MAMGARPDVASRAINRSDGVQRNAGVGTAFGITRVVNAAARGSKANLYLPTNQGHPGAI